jgi:hypothetical protein
VVERRDFNVRSADSSRREKKKILSLIVFRTISWLSGMMVWGGGILAGILVFLTSIRGRDYNFFVKGDIDSELYGRESLTMKKRKSLSLGQGSQEQKEKGAFLKTPLCLRDARPRKR